MRSLDESRAEINKIDKQLIKLLQDRLKVVVDVGTYKQNNGLEIYQSDRENEVIETIINSLETGLEFYAYRFMATLMDICRDFQHKQIGYSSHDIPKPLNKFKCGLIGNVLSHSLSPRIHNDFFNIFNIDGSYSLFQVPESKSRGIVQSLKTLGIDAANVTIPYKEVVMPQLDEISPDAIRIGSVNTIKLVNGKSYGYNTDYYGIGAMFEKGEVDIKGNDFYVLGSGGSAKSVIRYLKDKEANNITVVTRNIPAATTFLGDIVNDIIDYNQMKNISNSYCVINTTPVGMYPNIDNTPIDSTIIKKFEVAVDLVYRPVNTQFLLEAKNQGLRTVSGLYMLVAQAVKSEEIWLNIPCKKEIIEKLFDMLSKYLDITKQSLFLVGFMGAGKTTVGEKLALSLNIPFKDCDKFICNKYGLTITEIFEQYGEEYFRQIEAEALIELNSLGPAIIATGGGCVTNNTSKNFLMTKNCVYLKYGIDTLYARIKGDANRPLVDNKENLDKRLQSRDVLYQEVATEVIECETLSVLNIVDLIINRLEQNNAYKNY